jgi:hypothetical protein
LGLIDFAIVVALGTQQLLKIKLYFQIKKTDVIFLLKVCFQTDSPLRGLRLG